MTLQSRLRACSELLHSFHRRLRAVRGLAPLKLTRAPGGVNKMGGGTFHICKGSLDTVFSMDWRWFFVPGAFGKGIERLCGVLAAPTARELRRLLGAGLARNAHRGNPPGLVEERRRTPSFPEMVEGALPTKGPVDRHLPAAGWRRGIRGRCRRRTLLADAGESSRLRVVRPGSGNASRVAGEKRGRLCGAGENSAFDARFSENAGVSQEADGASHGRRHCDQGCRDGAEFVG